MRRSSIPRKTREQKSEEVRDALFQAAAETVGEYGYMDTSITRITQRARVAQGTFYNYFESRQHIFDELLPVLGTKMIVHIRQEVRGATTFIEREERSFRAFFNFLKRMPYFLRILNEAEIFAPRAYKAHFKNIVDGYSRFLRKAVLSGEIVLDNDEEIDATVYFLMSARGYLAMRYLRPDGKIDVPEEAVRSYMRLISGGLMKHADSGAGNSVHEKESPVAATQ